MKANLRRRIVLMLVSVLAAVVALETWAGWTLLREYSPVISVARPLDTKPNPSVPFCPFVEARRRDHSLKTTAEKLHGESVLLKKDAAARLEHWKTPDGLLWMPEGNMGNVSYILAEGHVGGNDERSSIRQGSIVLDCGAHIGLTVRRALAAGAGLVVAIELAPDNIECLRRNLADEIRAGKVVVYPKGVWNKEDVLVMNEGGASAEDSVAKGNVNRNGKKVPLTTIDRLVAELRLSKVDYIKIDIEGAEREALEGAQETLRRFHPRLALAGYHLADDPSVLPAWIQRADNEADYWFSFRGCRVWANEPRPESILAETRPGLPDARR